MNFLEGCCIAISLVATYCFGDQPFYGALLSILSSFLGLIIYYQYQALGHMCLNVYYVLAFSQMAYRSSAKQDWKISHRLSSKTLFILSASVLCIFFSSPTAIIFYDSCSFFSAICATELMRRGYIEHWSVWIVHNFTSALLNYKKGLFLFALKKFTYLILGLRGYMLWRKKLSHF